MVPMPSHEPLPQEQRRVLLDLAAESIRHGLEHGRAVDVRKRDYPETLTEIRATFVTLNMDGQLRGCIGTLVASAPLAEDVATHAYAAAFQDPRFPPVTAAEVDKLHIHISILTPETPISFTNETDLLQKLVPGEDGLTIAQGFRKATFLPSVWDSLPDPATFLQHLKLKAGISGSPEQAWRYHTESFS